MTREKLNRGTCTHCGKDVALSSIKPRAHYLDDEKRNLCPGVSVAVHDPRMWNGEEYVAIQQSEWEKKNNRVRADVRNIVRSIFQLGLLKSSGPMHAAIEIALEESEKCRFQRAEALFSLCSYVVSNATLDQHFSKAMKLLRDRVVEIDAS
jgi:hypothetical protein